jgi:hypothetical protein
MPRGGLRLAVAIFVSSGFPLIYARAFPTTDRQVP